MFSIHENILSLALRATDFKKNIVTKSRWRVLTNSTQGYSANVVHDFRKKPPIITTICIVIVAGRSAAFKVRFSEEVLILYCKV